jgi:hypothetical protein
MSIASKMHHTEPALNLLEELLHSQLEDYRVCMMKIQVLTVIEAGV